MDTKFKYLLIIAFSFLLIGDGFSQAETSKGGSDDHSRALHRIYKKITTPEERAKLAAENPDETFLKGDEVFEEEPAEEITETQSEDLPFGNVVEYDEFSQTNEDVSTAEIYQVMEYDDFKNPTDNDPSKTPVIESENVIEMEEYDPVIAAQPVTETTSVESTPSAIPSTSVESPTESTTNSLSTTSVEYTPTSSSTLVSTQYQIQLGYFGNVKNATRLSEKAKSQYSEPVSIVEDYKKGEVYYRVLLGGFDDLNDAQKLYQAIRKNGAKATIKKQ